MTEWTNRWKKNPEIRDDRGYDFFVDFLVSDGDEICIGGYSTLGVWQADIEVEYWMPLPLPPITK